MIQKVFDLSKFGLEHGLLLEDGVVSPSVYRNICFTACRLNEFDWALDFLTEYKEKLEERYRDNAYSFNLARVYWYGENYEKVIETLRNVEYEDLFYNRTSKLMLISSYYELQEYNVLDSTLKSFVVFLRRKRNIPAAVRNSILDFTKVINHLLKAGERRDVRRLKSAREVISSNPAIPNKEWLLDKTGELEAILEPGTVKV